MIFDLWWSVLQIHAPQCKNILVLLQLLLKEHANVILEIIGHKEQLKGTINNLGQLIFSIVSPPEVLSRQEYLEMILEEKGDVTLTNNMDETGLLFKRNNACGLDGSSWKFFRIKSVNDNFRLSHNNQHAKLWVK